MRAHPIAAAAGGGFCYIDEPHVHDYAPDTTALFQRVGEIYVFTGDPVPFGYAGDTTVFYGLHPIPTPEPVMPAAGGAPSMFCFMKGPHRHEFTAPTQPGAGYQQKEGVVFYIGPVAPETAHIRAEREPAIEAAYLPFSAQRPQVTVKPPPEWLWQPWTPPPPAPIEPDSELVALSPGAADPASRTIAVAPSAPRVKFVMRSGHYPVKHKAWRKRGLWK